MSTMSTTVRLNAKAAPLPVDPDEVPPPEPNKERAAPPASETPTQPAEPANKPQEPEPSF